MSDHGHDEHHAGHGCASGGCGHADSHAHGVTDGHDTHDHGHDDHGHGHDDHGHGGWGDYNKQAPAPSTLPAIPAWGMLSLGLVLALIVYSVVATSLNMAAASAHGGNSAHEATGGNHEPAKSGGHATEKAEHTH